MKHTAWIIVTLILCYFHPTLALTDNDPRCRDWAEHGECQNNPNYMLNNCQKSCKYMEEKYGIENTDDLNIQSFYELSAKDIDGRLVDFSSFQNKVVIVTNVASFCGYTESHYKSLVQLWDQVKGTGKVEILAFPCNQFGGQEPDACPLIKKFAQEKGVEFQMMYKIDVNGPNASPVYKFLKRAAGPQYITWNFATYFVISPSGQVRSYSGVEPLSLIDLINGLVEDEL